jgi:hypothetical protein
MQNDPTEVIYEDYTEWLNGYPIEYYDNWIAGHSAHQFDDCGKPDCWYCVYWRTQEELLNDSLRSVEHNKIPSQNRC